MLEPYRQLWHHAQPAHKSVLVSPATTVFPGFAGAVARREGFVLVVSLTTILAKFAPTLLSTIPFNPAQTWQMHLVCAWLTVGCLGHMTLVLGYRIAFVAYPHLPVDPGCLAGRIYYLCDSALVADYEGMATLRAKEFGSRVAPTRRYRFGKMVGVSGESRIGVDYQ